MRFIRHVTPLLIVLLAGPALADDAYTFDSGFYRITTDVDEGLAREIAAHMDAVFAEYTRRFTDFRARVPEHQPLHVYATREGYERFLAGHGLDGGGTSGVFFVQPTGSALATFVGDRSLDRMYHALRHEGFHQFAHAAIGDRLPMWANEGMAEYFGEAILVGDGLWIGQVPPDRLERLGEWVRAGRHLPMERLLGLSAEQWSARLRGGDGTIQYDQAWSVVHFLVHGDPRRRAAFEGYLDRLARGERHEAAFERAFGTSDFAAVERAWVDFLGGLEPTPEKAAAQRLEFLGEGLRMLHERGRTPSSFAELDRSLRSMRFRMRQPIGHGMMIERSAEDRSMFQPPQPRESRRRARFELLRPERGRRARANAAALPPGLAVRGPGLAVRLRWTRNAAGDPISQVIYE